MRTLERGIGQLGSQFSGCKVQDTLSIWCPCSISKAVVRTGPCAELPSRSLLMKKNNSEGVRVDRDPSVELESQGGMNLSLSI